MRRSVPVRPNLPVAAERTPLPGAQGNTVLRHHLSLSLCVTPANQRPGGLESWQRNERKPGRFASASSASVAGLRLQLSAWLI